MLAYFLTLENHLHTHKDDAVCIDIERSCASYRAEFIKMAVQFLFDPLDAVLEQGDEIKMGMEQFGEVFLRLYDFMVSINLGFYKTECEYKS